MPTIIVVIAISSSLSFIALCVLCGFIVVRTGATRGLRDLAKVVAAFFGWGIKPCRQCLRQVDRA